MCEPTTIAVATMALTAYSGYQQGRAQRAQGIAQGNYYDYIANQKEIEAQEAMKRGSLESNIIQTKAKEEGKELKRQQAQLSASQIASMVAKGMDVSSVSAENLASSTYETQRLDELALRYNADIKTWGTMTDASYKSWASKTQAEQARYSAGYARQAGRTAMRNTYMKTGASLLGQAFTFGSAGAFGGGTSTQGVSGWLKGYGAGTPKNTMDMGSFTAFTPK